MATKQMLTRLLCAFACTGLMSAALADELFSIGEGGEHTWTEALNQQMIRPLNPALGDHLTESALIYYSGLGVPFRLVESVLTPDIPWERHDSLVMQWEEPRPPELTIGAWQFEYGVDPDLTGTLIEFSIYPPQGVNDVELTLIDNNGKSRSWGLNNPSPGWTNWTVVPDDPANPPAGWVVTEDPPFDITQVTTIRLAETGFSTTFPPPPPGSSGPGVAWNAWNHLRVVPEPATALLVALGAAVLIRRRS